MRVLKPTPVAKLIPIAKRIPSAGSNTGDRLISCARLQPELGLMVKQRLAEGSAEHFVNAVARPSSASKPALRPGLQKCRANRAPTPMSAQLECFARSLSRHGLPRAR